VNPSRLGLRDAVLELGLHQWVETRGGLVQHEQLDVGGQRRDQRDLLPVALAIGASLLGRVELETLQQVGLARFGGTATQP
jgi:hypothetical protein